MPHSNEALLREIYELFAKGDVPGFLALCTPDITFQVPGNGLLAGNSGRDEFLAKLGPAMQAVGGTFREGVVRVVANQDDGCVMAAQRADRDGAHHQWMCVHWWTFRDGKAASFREFVDDAAAFEAAWRR